MRLLAALVLLTGLYGSCAQNYGPLEVDEAHNQDPVSWIFEHMKLVAIIGAAISAAGVVLIVGLSIVDCLVNSSKIAPILDDSGPQAQHTQQSMGRKMHPAGFSSGEGSVPAVAEY